MFLKRKSEKNATRLHLSIFEENGELVSRKLALSIGKGIMPERTNDSAENEASIEIFLNFVGEKGKYHNPKFLE